MKQPKEREPLFKVKQTASVAGKLDYEIVSDKKINLTKERAYEFLDMATFEGERQPSDKHVQELYEAWLDGQFIWPHVEIGLCKVGDKTYRVNGQHTCWMRTNLPENEECVVREVTYRVADEHDLRRLYCTFDNSKPRTYGHQFKTMVTGSNMLQGVGASMLGPLCSGLKLWIFPEGKHTHHKVTAVDMAAIAMEKHNELFNTVGIMLGKYRSDFTPMKRASVLAAMFATYDACPSKAPEFWEPVFNGCF